MIDYAARVRKFMNLAGQNTPDMPHGGSTSLAAFRVALMDEEINELEVAMQTDDIVGIADGLADLLYVVFGTALAYGMPIDQIFDEVHRSNMTKFVNGHFETDASGKVIKPESYEPPDIEAVIERHSTSQSAKQSMGLMGGER